MIFIAAAILALVQEAELQKIAVRVDSAALLSGAEADKERSAAGRAALKAGPAVLPYLAKLFPGHKSIQPPGCGNFSYTDVGFLSEVVRVMLSFGEPAVPHLVPFVMDRDSRTRWLAVLALANLKSTAAVDPLIDALSDKAIMPAAQEALELTTFRKFARAEDYRDWHAAHRNRTRAEWLVEVVGIMDVNAVDRRAALKATPILPPQQRLDALITAYADAGWNEARMYLFFVTRINMDGGEQLPSTSALRDAESNDWREFRKRPAIERDVEIALHWGGIGAPWCYFTIEECRRVLRAHPVEAIGVTERLLDRGRWSAHTASAVLRYIVTSETYSRVAKLLAKPSFKGLAEGVFETADHPDFAPTLVELLVSGETGPNDVFCRTLSRLCGEREVPSILEKLSSTKGKAHQALLEGLGATGDRRAWETLKREMFEDEKQIWAARALANFKGDDVIAALRPRLNGGNVQSRAFTARVLADKGDNSGIPVILEDLGKEQDGIWFVMDSLAEITGRNVGEDFWAKKLTREKAHDWLVAWWAKNKSRSRIDWLLEAVAEGEPYSGNPLVTLAREELAGIERDATVKWCEAAVPRIRAWIEKTHFRFDKDTVRVPYRKIP